MIAYRQADCIAIPDVTAAYIKNSSDQSLVSGVPLTLTFLSSTFELRSSKSFFD